MLTVLILALLGQQPPTLVLADQEMGPAGKTAYVVKVRPDGTWVRVREWPDGTGLVAGRGTLTGPQASMLMTLAGECLAGTDEVDVNGRLESVPFKPGQRRIVIRWGKHLIAVRDMKPPGDASGTVARAVLDTIENHPERARELAGVAALVAAVEASCGPVRSAPDVYIPEK